MARSTTGPQLSWERPRLLDSTIELALKSSTVAILVPAVLAAAWIASGRSLDAAAEAGDAPAMPLLTGLLASFVMVPMLALAGAAAAVLSGAWTLRGPAPVSTRALRATLPLAVAAAGLAAAYFHVAILVPVMTGA
jgi:hypothetical protein